MKVYLIGVGMGNPDTLTLGARRAIEACPVLIGAPRLLEPWGEGHTCVPLVAAADIALATGPRRRPIGPLAGVAAAANPHPEVATVFSYKTIRFFPKP